MADLDPNSPRSAPPPGIAAASVREGWARVSEHWSSVGAAYLLSLVLSLPLAAALHASLAASLAHREAAERLLQGWDGLWHKTFAGQAQGIEATFDAGVVGIGAVLRSLDALVTGGLFDVPAPIVTVGVLYLLGWLLLSGALLARFRGEPGGLLSLGRKHMVSLIKVAVVGWLAWSVVLGSVLPLLSDIVEAQCRDVIDERVHVAWIVGKYAVVWALMFAIRVVVDYAKVAIIDEPTRSTLGALRVALGVCRWYPWAVFGVLWRVGLVSLALLVAYAVVAPGAGQGNGFRILVAFGISQSSVVARVVMRAWTLGSEQALVRAVSARA
ncbi:MAG: hypothetical protein K0V04_42085 [Deltaproteobacteria bacterium]|nr:hypothetical protein [Deltaproteobacteria bacterium]